MYFHINAHFSAENTFCALFIFLTRKETFNPSVYLKIPATATLSKSHYVVRRQGRWCQNAILFRNAFCRK